MRVLVPLLEFNHYDLVELAGARVIVAKVEPGVLKLELPCHILEVPPMEGARREEAFCCFEVARAQQKAQLVGWGAKLTPRGDGIRLGNQNTVCAGHC